MNRRLPPALSEALHTLAEPHSSLACRLWLRIQVRNRDAAEKIFRQLHREELLRLQLRPSGWWSPTKIVVLTAVILTGAIAAIAINTARPPVAVCVPVVAPSLPSPVESSAPVRPACVPEHNAAHPH